jgi:hypothetical protein
MDSQSISTATFTQHIDAHYSVLSELPLIIQYKDPVHMGIMFSQGTVFFLAPSEKQGVSVVRAVESYCIHIPAQRQLVGPLH